jgi:hypothetical protein
VWEAVRHTAQGGRAGCGCALLSARALLVLQGTGGGISVGGGSASLNKAEIANCTSSTTSEVC